MFFLKASLINLNTIRPIYDSLNGHISGPKHIGVTLLIAVSTCIFSLGCAFILWWLDNRHRRIQCENNSNDAGLYFILFESIFHNGEWMCDNFRLHSITSLCIFHMYSTSERPCYFVDRCKIFLVKTKENINNLWRSTIIDTYAIYSSEKRSRCIICVDFCSKMTNLVW